jgi:hypothetical protein
LGKGKNDRFINSLMLVSVSAYGEPKLIVKDAGGTNTVFQVEDTGVVTVPLGGVTIPSAFDSPSAFRFGVEDNYSGLQGVAAGSQTWNKFYLFGDRARGTIASPTVPQAGDGVFEFLGRIYDGDNLKATAGIQFNVDGAVSNEVAPQRIDFATGTAATRSVRMTIQSDGDVVIDKLKGTYGGGSAYVCVYNSGQLYTSETGCP